MPDDRVQSRLRFVYNRRAFWRALFQEVLVVSGVLQGGRECRLEDLGDLPDHELAKIRPLVHPACEIFVEGDHVWGRSRRNKSAVKLFRSDDASNWMTLGMFDGDRTLGEIGACLAEALDQEEDWGFSHARELFLSLANLLICIPKDPPGPGEE
jgi:hypothetical protein